MASFILTLWCFKGTTDVQFGVKQALTLEGWGGGGIVPLHPRVIYLGFLNCNF